MIETIAQRARADRAEALTTLRRIFPRGAHVPVLVVHVSPSGTSRDIVVLQPYSSTDSTVGGTTERPTVRNVSHLIVKAGIGQAPRSSSRRAVTIGGAGMDMTFHLVYALSQTLYGPDAGYSLTADNLT